MVMARLTFFKAELLALQKGMAFCQSMDLSPIQIEEDCLVPITRIQNTAHLSWDLMIIWKKKKKKRTM